MSARIGRIAGPRRPFSGPPDRPVSACRFCPGRRVPGGGKVRLRLPRRLTAADLPGRHPRGGLHSRDTTGQRA
jgi:hypothetical protein